jgi:hypothetical protein
MPYYLDAQNTLHLMIDGRTSLEAEIAKLESIVDAEVTASLQGAPHPFGTPPWIKLANARLIREKHLE